MNIKHLGKKYYVLSEEQLKIIAIALMLLYYYLQVHNISVYHYIAMALYITTTYNVLAELNSYINNIMCMVLRYNIEKLYKNTIYKM